MMEQVRMIAPALRVLMDDGASWEVQTVNRDLVLWDRTRVKQRPVWPPMADAPFLWLTFIAWAASRREGLTTLEYDGFESACVSVDNLDTGEDDDAGEAAGDPTRPGPVPG